MSLRLKSIGQTSNTTCPPTEKQIRFTEDIAKVLNIDFPTTSKEFTKRTYCNFINAHYEDFQMAMDDANVFNTEDEMVWFQMLNG